MLAAIASAMRAQAADPRFHGALPTFLLAPVLIALLGARLGELADRVDRMGPGVVLPARG